MSRNYKGSKPRTGNNRGSWNKSAGERTEKTQSHTLSYNSKGSYVNSKILVENTSNFNWQVPAGTNVDSIYGQGNTGSSNIKTESFPSLMAFKVQPTMGIANSTDSPIHRLSLVLYRDLIRINSMNAPYDPVDIAKFVFAELNLSMFIEWCKRLYRIAGTYVNENRSVPDTLLIANNVNPEDFKKNMKDFQKWLNLYILSASTVKCPDGLPFFDELNHLMANVFIDEESPKAQMYMFVPDLFYRYCEIEDPLDPSSYNGARLLPEPIWDEHNSSYPENHFAPQFNASLSLGEEWVQRSHRWTTDEIMVLGDKILTPLLNSTDVYRLQADIGAVYGDGSLRKYTELDSQEVLTAIYDTSMLRKIENLRITGHAMQYEGSGTSIGSIVGNYYPVIEEVPGINKGYLVFNYIPRLLNGYTVTYPAIVNEELSEDSLVLLNNHGSMPTDADTYELTTFVPTFTEDFIPFGEDDDLDVVRVESCGLALIVDCNVYSRMWMKNGQVNVFAINYPWYIIPQGTESITNAMRKFAAFDKFDWHPMLQYIGYEGTYKSKDILLDVDIYCEPKAYNIAQIHEVRIVNAFNAPGSQYSLN